MEGYLPDIKRTPHDNKIILALEELPVKETLYVITVQKDGLQFTKIRHKARRFTLKQAIKLQEDYVNYAKLHLCS